ncbi:MAG: HRDC domain-containing protein [Muribaculaceae bacterium]|nr:HRDC domain-containing protein [Muribaculaceae bacterium]
MQLKFFTIPIICGEDHEDSLNRFLRSVRVLEIKRELVSVADAAYWAVCVLFLANNQSDHNASAVKGKVDYKTLLSDGEFKKFCMLRKVRKQLADADAVPAFAVFTDSELSEISRLDEVSMTSLKRINGVGNKKLEKYGDKFCSVLSSMIQGETGDESV